MPQKDAHAFLPPNHVVDHFGEQHRLAHAGSAEEARLTATFQRREDIDDLDARLEDFGPSGTPRQGRRSSMYGTPLDRLQGRPAVDDVSKNVEHPREHFIADGRLQRPACVVDRHPTSETLGGGQCDPAYSMSVELSKNFDGDRPLLRMQQRVDRGQIRIELDIHDTAAYRDDGTEIRRADFVSHVCSR
jgi:hypothetical protein